MSKVSRFAALASLVGFAAASHASVLVVPGWTITYPDDPTGMGNSVSLTDLGAGNNGARVLEKFVDFHIAGAVPIVFTKTDPVTTHLSFIIQDETVVNDTAGPFNQFVFGLVGGATFNTTATVGFLTAPFPNGTYSLGNTLLTATGGTLPNGMTSPFPGNIWTPGSSSGLVINAPNTFTLLESPVPLPEPMAAGLAMPGTLLLARRRRA